MASKQRLLGLTILLATTVLVVGCSSKGTKKEGDELEATLSQGDAELPAADEVGSIPEDNSDALSELSKSPSEAGADPFADLEDNLGEAAAKAEDGAPATSGGSGEMRDYKVKRGDTLMKIAFKLYGDIDRWKDLKSWNSGTVGRASALEKGTVLKYRDEGEFVLEKHDYSYKIQNGDTLGGIAKNIYGRQNKWKKLRSFNQRLIKDPNRIFAGFLLYYNITPEEQQEAERMRGAIGSAPPAAAPEHHEAMSPPPVSAESPPVSAAAPTMPAAEPIKNDGAAPVAAAPGGSEPLPQ